MDRFWIDFHDIETADYLRLRKDCGLSPKTVEAANKGLRNSLCSVLIRDREQQMKAIGMGRLIGDGGCHCQVVDICVLPEFQGKGLGKEIMNRLKDYINRELPDSCYVSLIADGEAYKLYLNYEFKEVWPISRGMGFKK